jgi:hypothetical protein
LRVDSSPQEAYKFSEAFYGALGQQFGRPFETAFADAVATYQAFWAKKGQAELKRLGKTRAYVPLLVPRKSGHDAPTAAPPQAPPLPWALPEGLFPSSPSSGQPSGLPSGQPSGLAKALSAPLPAPGVPVMPPQGTPQGTPQGGWLGDAAPPRTVPPDALAFTPPVSAWARTASEPAPRAWTGVPLHWLRDDQKESPGL